MGDPGRLEQLERKYRADIAARLPQLSDEVTQLLVGHATRIADCRDRSESCCSAEWRDFAAWVTNLSPDDAVFRLLAGFSTINWVGILERYFDFDVGCDSFGLTAVNNFCYRQQLGPTASDHRKLLHLLIIDALAGTLLLPADDPDVAAARLF
jgi:hypothetical protein